MKQFLERASIFGSLPRFDYILSISSALPAMFDYYQGYPKEQIELLASFAILWNHDYVTTKWFLRKNIS